MVAALAAALTLVPAPYARGETLTWAQVKARAELSRMLGEEP
ncbi:hypothetical protein ACSRUE_45760 [Sorangium sp. KYC3313]